MVKGLPCCTGASSGFRLRHMCPKGGGNYVGGISRNDKNGPEIAPRRTGNQTIQHFWKIASIIRYHQDAPRTIRNGEITRLGCIRTHVNMFRGFASPKCFGTTMAQTSSRNRNNSKRLRIKNVRRGKQSSTKIKLITRPV